MAIKRCVMIFLSVIMICLSFPGYSRADSTYNITTRWGGVLKVVISKSASENFSFSAVQTKAHAYGFILSMTAYARDPSLSVENLKLTATTSNGRQAFDFSSGVGIGIASPVPLNTVRITFTKKPVKHKSEMEVFSLLYEAKKRQLGGKATIYAP